jgi:hypothetical protein
LQPDWPSRSFRQHPLSRNRDNECRLHIENLQFFHERRVRLRAWDAQMVIIQVTG